MGVAFAPETSGSLFRPKDPHCCRIDALRRKGAERTGRTLGWNFFLSFFSPPQASSREILYAKKVSFAPPSSTWAKTIDHITF